MPERGARSAGDGVRFAIGTGFGIGYAPVASGTFGSLPGVALAWALATAGGWPALLAGTLAVTAAGLWSAGSVERRLGRTDPGEVVIDEIAGQMVALLLLPPGPWVLLASFLLFRAADIVKPPPARRLEGLPGALGIMVDDLVAGAYANLALQVLIRVFPAIAGSA